MAIVKGLVEAVSTKWDKYSVQVNGSWYSTKMEWATIKPNKGDMVEFDDGGSKFTKNMKLIAAGAGGVYGAPKPRSFNNNLGIELGHAANLAVQIALAEDLPPASTEFYKSFAANTRKCYAIMKGLREEFDAAATDAATPAPDSEVVVVRSKPVEEVTAEDIF